MKMEKFQIWEFFTLSFTFHIVCQYFTEKLSLRYKQNPLLDLAHEICKDSYFQIGFNYNDIIAGILILTIFVFGEYQHIESYVLHLSILMILRSISFTLTILPDPSSQSHKKTLLAKILTGGCSDLLFSGHISYSFLSLLYCHHYNLMPNILQIFLYIILIILSILIIIQRKHYSVDVYYGYLITYLLYKAYLH